MLPQEPTGRVPHFMPHLNLAGGETSETNFLPKKIIKRSGGRNCSMSVLRLKADIREQLENVR